MDNVNNQLQSITYRLHNGESFVISGADIDNFVLNMFNATNQFLENGGKLLPVDWKREKSLSEILAMK